MSETYTVKIAQFEGPFDLLLFFIERDELDIYDIPIAKITDDFLTYLHEMDVLNIDLASEFVLVAATLCRIKAKLLLPRKEKDEEGNEIDPREELVQRLLEYRKYKSVLDEMRDMEEARSNREYRGNISSELKKIANKALVDVELESLTLFRLLKTFERVTEQFKLANHKQIHQIVQFSYTIEESQTHILSVVQTQKKASFKSLFSACTNRIHAIVTFLALLELANMEKVFIISGEGANNFWVEKSLEQAA